VLFRSPNQDSTLPVHQIDLPVSTRSSRASLHTHGPILHVLCVAFHHRNGPQVEFANPEFPEIIRASTSAIKHTRTTTSNSTKSEAVQPIDLPDEWNFLPFICLPDGAHAVDEEFIYFHLPPVPSWDSHYQSTVFGLACYRQIKATELTVKAADVTRSTVQKAVVVLASVPLLGSVKSKLGMVTEALFAQKDFSHLDILDTLYESLAAMIPKSGPIPDSSLYMGISLRDLVYKFRQKTLILFKLLLLGRRVLFFGQKVERVTSYQSALVSLIPDLLRNLKDSAAIDLQFQSGPPGPSTSQESINFALDPYRAKISKFNLPLRIFGKGYVWLPYITLQQIDVLLNPDTKGFIVGTSNTIFTQHTACNIEVIVNTDTGAVDINEPTLAAALSLTSADKIFIEEITKSVVGNWVDGDQDQIEFEGSDDDIRSRFEMYLLSLLVSSKSMQEPPVVEKDKRPVNYFYDYNANFVKTWQNSPSYKTWNEETSIEALKEGVPNNAYPVNPGHPYQGTSTISAVQSSISARFTEFSKSLQNTNVQGSVEKAIIAGDGVVKGVVNAVTDKQNQERVQQGANQFFNGLSGWYTQKKKEWSAVPVPSTGKSASTIPKSEISLSASMEEIDLNADTGLQILSENQ